MRGCTLEIGTKNCQQIYEAKSNPDLEFTNHDKIAKFLYMDISGTRPGILSKMEEKIGNALKELSDQLAMKKQNCWRCIDKQNFWESSGFKFVVSMSMLALVVIKK